MKNNRINKRSIYLLLTCIILVVPLISCSRTNSRLSRTKILFIGLDGASWNVLDALLKEDKLPNIKYLASHGCRASVNTLEPMVSPLIWTSIATGKMPDKHGIMGFTAKQPKSGIEIPVTSNLRKAQAIWNILSYYKKSVGVFGYLVTWPAERVNGCLVSDRAFEANYLSKGYAYPELNKLCSEAKFKDIQSHALKEKPRMYHDAPDRFILDFVLSL
ncbi:MAG: alkaline phosphatase family protein, partial [Candidatus Omnitrophota bacterium]|nr:alkaline phosphatase family protein [Candidatus Omnitrophota bacterium]